MDKPKWIRGENDVWIDVRGVVAAVGPEGAAHGYLLAADGTRKLGLWPLKDPLPTNWIRCGATATRPDGAALDLSAVSNVSHVFDQAGEALVLGAAGIWSLGYVRGEGQIASIAQALGIDLSAPANALRPNALVNGTSPRKPRALMRSEGDKHVIYDPRIKAHVTVVDRARELEKRQAPPPSPSDVDRFLSRRRSATTGRRHVLGQLQAGVTFKEHQLDYRDSTAAYYYLLAPREKGGPAGADLLYVTSTNRSFQGCEALLAYSGPPPYHGQFRIWDWQSHRAANTEFVRTWDLDSLEQYLIPCQFNDLDVEALYVMSVTRREGAGAGWVNEVYLHNRETGNRDRVWQNPYVWPDPPTQDEWGWWGPIFEAFPDNAALGPCNPIGFDAALLVQDGYERVLSDANSVLVEPSGDGLTIVSRIGNSGLVAR